MKIKPGDGIAGFLGTVNVICSDKKGMGTGVMRVYGVDRTQSYIK